MKPDLMTVVIFSSIALYYYFFIIHIIKLIKIDKFSINSFKAGHSKVIIKNYNFNIYNIKSAFQNETSLKYKNISSKKCILITEKRKPFSFHPRDIFFPKDVLLKSRSIIDYSNNKNITVTLYWNNNYIFQLYIFIMMIPLAILSSKYHPLTFTLILIISFIVFYLVMHKFELLKIKKKEHHLRSILK